MLDLLKGIEQLRQEMHDLASMKGLSSSDVIYISRQIDNKLNHYYKYYGGKFKRKDGNHE
jgi:hypothetical protein